MNVKSSFINGVISEEVNDKQLTGFEDPVHSDHVLKLKKPLYGIKQALRSWYERLGNFLLEIGFQKGQVDTTLFRKTLKNNILIIQVDIDDIIFDSTSATICKEFSKSM